MPERVAGTGAAACTLSFADGGFIFDVLDTLANRPQPGAAQGGREEQCDPAVRAELRQREQSRQLLERLRQPGANTFGSRVMVSPSFTPDFAIFSAERRSAVLIYYSLLQVRSSWPAPAISIRNLDHLGFGRRTPARNWALPA